MAAPTIQSISRATADWILPAAGLKEVGIVGLPPLEIIRFLHDHEVRIHDLDALLTRADLETAAPYLPRVYCAILRTVMVNALHLDLDAIFIDVGPGKCDSAFHVAAVLADTIAIPVIRTENTDMEEFGTPLCRAKMPLLDKMLAITEGVKSADPHDPLPPSCPPSFGFWGVPPRDFSILQLFPDTTHVYGWTRCMENKTPANSVLEAHCNPEVPTVFFAQTFCAKTALAKLLARKHPCGLYLDADVSAGSSAKAKIQAFLELRGKQK